MFLENQVSCRQECEVQCYRELIVQYVGNYALFLLRIWSSQHVKNLDLNLLYSHIPHYSILCFLTTSQHRVCAVKWIENIDAIFGSEDKYSQNRSKCRHAKHYVIPHWTINLKMMPWEVIRWTKWLIWPFSIFESVCDYTVARKGWLFPVSLFSPWILFPFLSLR